MKRDFRKPYRIIKKKSILKNRFFWLGILILAIIGGIFYLIYFYSFFQVKEIKVAGNQKVTSKDIDDVAQNQIWGKIIFTQSKSIFLVDFNRTKKSLLERFPQLNTVNLKRDFPDKIQIVVEERKPAAIFVNNEEDFLIDKEGIIFEKTSNDMPEFLKIKNSTLQNNLILGEKAIEGNTLLKILDIKSKLKEKLKISLGEVSLAAEDRLNFKTDEGWEIYFGLKEDTDWQLTKLETVLDKEIPQEKRGNLEYIDLRFGNFANYKYR